jgi:Na+-driven multidrug efflux pump
MIELAVLGGMLLALALLAGSGLVPRAFSSDPAVLDRAEDLSPLFALLWPVAAAVFALDGILIGAGDARYLAGAMAASAAVYVPLLLCSMPAWWGCGPR